MIVWCVFFWSAYRTKSLFFHWIFEGGVYVQIALFSLWLFPLLSIRPLLLRSDFWLLFSISLNFLGQAGALHLLDYFGFAAACAAFFPVSYGSVFWVFSSIGWMPALHWFAVEYPPIVQIATSFCLICVGVWSLLLQFQKEVKT